MKENAIHIVACASDDYTMPCGVMMQSACANAGTLPLCFWLIVDNGFTQKNKDLLTQEIEGNGQEIHFITVTDKQIDAFLPFENYYYTRHVFYRLLMADLLPDEVGKALYLDCDIIVRHPLDDLWGIDITRYAVGCVHDAQEAVIEKFNRLGFPYAKGYFNSGVLLANLTYWRNNHVARSFIEYIKNHNNKIVLPDQDVLNAVLQDHKLFIPIKYNTQNEFYFKPRLMNFDYSLYKDEINEAVADPVVLHFSGVRPWLKGASHPEINEFEKYKRQTVWKQDKPQGHRRKLKVRIINSLRPLLSKFGICHVIEDPYDYQRVASLLSIQ